MTDRPPDVEIAATVKADELRFERKPKVDVIPYANAPASVERESERHNLPPDIEEGVTYREVAISWRLGVRLED